MNRNGNWLRGAPGVWRWAPTHQPPPPEPAPVPPPSPAEQALADIQAVLDAYQASLP